MKKRIRNKTLLILLMLLATFIFCGCNAFCDHNYVTVHHEEQTCKKDGLIEEECSECGKVKSTKLKREHKYEYAGCMEYEKCKFCGKNNDVLVKHTTENGRCEVCDEIFVSKSYKSTAEYERHGKALVELQKQYTEDIGNVNAQIARYKAYCTLPIDELNAKIASLNSKIQEKQRELDSISGSGGVATSKRLNLQLTIQNLQSEKSKYQSMVSKWRSIDDLENKKADIERQYAKDIEAETKRHEQALLAIEKLKY